MNKSIVVVLAAAVLCGMSCTKTVETDPFSPGICVAECQVGSAAGSLSVLVETAGTWRIRCDVPWLETDVKGGVGRGAFTFRYTSNEADILHQTGSRIGRIAICLDEGNRADSLRIVQHGFISRESKGSVGQDPALQLEFDNPPLKRVSVLVVNTDGQASAAAWAQGKADILVVDGVVSGDLDGLCIKGCDLSALGADAEYVAFRQLIEEGFSESPADGWMLCGTMNHYSMMQIGYPETPQWYPSDARSDEFRSDRYAWQNNLYDLLWMKERCWFSTWTDGLGRSWAADYIYVSSALLRQVAEVDILDIPLPEMTHNPLKVTFRR